jgi:hypothetical protein
MKPLPSRAEFLLELKRAGLLTGLLGISGAALHGQREVSECFSNNHCEACWSFNGCSLPEKKELPHERADETRSA